MIDFNSLFKYKSLINLWTTQILQALAAIALVRLQVCTKACTTAVFPWVNAIYGLSNTAFQEKCLRLLLIIISFGATKFFLTWIKTYSYGPVTIVGEGAFSCIIPQGILEIIFFLGETVCPLENVNLFGVPGSGGATSKFESKQTAMNSSLHEELRALASNLLRWCSYKTCNPTFFPSLCWSISV